MKPTCIILHHSLTKDSGTVSWGAIRKWHMGLIGQPDIFKPNYNPYVKNPMSNIGYHFGIELIGDYYEILVGRMMNQPGAHTLKHNDDSIGICLVGSFDIDEVPPEQWNKSIELVSWLCSIFRISYHDVYGHRDFAPYKSCPGKKFNIQSFRLHLIATELDK